MDDETMKDTELEQFNERTSAIDGPTQLAFNPTPSPIYDNDDSILIQQQINTQDSEAKEQTFTRKKKKTYDFSLMGKEIVNKIPDAIKSIIPSIVKAFNTHVVPNIVPPITRSIEDAVTVLTNESTKVHSSIHELKTSVAILTSTVNDINRVVHSTPSTPRSISSICNVANLDNCITPSTSRAHHSVHPSRSPYRESRPPRIPSHYRKEHSRSRSPQPIRRVHSRSRSPIRPIKQASQQKKPPQCALCKGFDHLSKNCKNNKSLSTRLSIMSNENRCKQCFRVLDHTHFPTCEPPLCHRGCTDNSGRLERHAEFFCPQNPSLTR